VATFPLTPPEAPGLPVTILTVPPTSAASPAALSFTIPEFGFYSFALLAWASNENNGAAIGGTIAYLKPISVNVLKTNVIGTAGMAGIVTGLTVVDPTSGGVVVATITYSGANTAVGGRLILHTLATGNELNTASI
jgi:hypothetical protein